MGRHFKLRSEPTIVWRFIDALRSLTAILAASTIALIPAHAAEPWGANLLDLTLEQLGNIEITSVSRHTEHLSDAAASVFVISSEDIRRSGATSLPEALRLAPNLQVARADNNQYAITARGFNSTLANKMLVLVDGRTVYSPFFSGVLWEAQDVMLEDVERIEVISGPGGTLWGSNAVNGVINVITRASGDTQGTLASIGGGNRDKGGNVRYGGKFGADGHYRVYGQYFDRPHTNRADGITSNLDESNMGQTGFRADWGTGAEAYTMQGDAYVSEIAQGITTRRISGMNVLGRWTRQLDGGANLRLQAYFDHNQRDQPGTIDDTLNTFDVEFQHGLKPMAQHNLMWGAGARYQLDRVDNINSAALAFLPPNRNLSQTNIFVQDEIALLHNLELTAGLKLESNNYTGLEFLPNVRLGWKPAAEYLLWGAVSRVVRAPARVDRDLYSPGTPPYFVLAGGSNFQSEVANVAEIGFRAQPFPALSYSITAFHHYLYKLRSLEPAPSGPMFENKIDGSVDGIETWATYRAAPWWRLSGGLVQQRQQLRPEPGSASIGGVALLGNDPTHWWKARSSFDLGTNHTLDVMVRHIGALPNPAVASYTAVDARFAWNLRRNLELSVTAQNLFDPRHAEWGVAAGRPEFARSVFVKLLWQQ